MEPDVIRMYSSSPPPMEDAAEEDDNEFGDFDTFSGVPNSISFTEFDTPTTFNQTQALTATSPPELLLLNNGLARRHGGGGSANGATRAPSGEPSKANGVALGCPPERTAETKRALSSSGPLGFSVSDAATPGVEERNGGDAAEVLTNGFATSDVQGSPSSSQNSVHSHIKEGASTEDTGSIPEDDFADFAAFSDAEGHCSTERGTTSEDDVRDTNRTGPDESGGADSVVSVSAAEARGGSRTDADADSGRQRDVAFAQERLASEGACANGPVALNGADAADSGDAACCYGEKDLSSPDAAGTPWDGKGSGNETETETETSLGRPLSTDALEEFGDTSTTGSAPSPLLLHGETATPGDHSQLAEDDDDDEDFGDFGDAGAFGAGQGFADFERLDVQREQTGPGNAGKTPEEEARLPVSDSFGNFSSAPAGDGGAQGWAALGESSRRTDGESWSGVTRRRQVFCASAREKRREGRRRLEEEEEEWHQSEHPAVSEETSTTDRQSVRTAPTGKVFVVVLSRGPGQGKGQGRPGPGQTRADQGQGQGKGQGRPGQTRARADQTRPDQGKGKGQGQSRPGQTRARARARIATTLLVMVDSDPSRGPRLAVRSGMKVQTVPSPVSLSLFVSAGSLRSVRGSVWTQLQDIHEALGLRYQWGGSYCNKALLCCLGIDTRNILFTGQKKQPVIVPMYAASLGMLEPTKEPVKPVSAAEMIASIAQAPPVAPEKSSCPSDSVQQEALPPVQFDWSSSGLTNPLDGR
ncbi:aftiphilin a [Perca fluviatilis]|uniref:aftiphilin a n=1 Tax=Perca fluviatilis TaxID=8168 RepID=UPI001964A3DA|nr:aftiphilin a [Perca fluviatilis]